jgi:hypothetical protein
MLAVAGACRGGDMTPGRDGRLARGLGCRNGAARMVRGAARTGWRLDEGKWLGDVDSNHDTQNQNLQSYH